jgi:hypothetical protein
MSPDAAAPPIHKHKEEARRAKAKDANNADGQPARRPEAHVYGRSRGHTVADLSHLEPLAASV